ARRHLFVALILPTGIERPGRHDLARLDPLEDRIGVGEGAIVVLRNNGAILCGEGRGEEKGKRVAETHFSSWHEPVMSSPMDITKEICYLIWDVQRKAARGTSLVGADTRHGPQPAMRSGVRRGDGGARQAAGGTVSPARDDTRSFP